MKRFLYFVFCFVAISYLAYFIRQNGATGSEQPDWLVLTLKILIGLLLAGFIWTMLIRERLTYAITSILAWGLIALILAVGYTYRFELRDVADRVKAELLPGHAATNGRLVEIVRNGNHFPVLAQVNGAHVAMLLDTGATSVVLTQEAARSAGLPLEVLAYTVNVETANGRTRAAPVTINAITVGSIKELGVPALIAQPGQLQTNLLGMSFLNRLQSWEVRGDKLMLRGRP